MAEQLIYPVPIKPASNISTWGLWPADVEPTVRAWNSGRLTFVRMRGVFKCSDCSAFCRAHTHGAARLDGDYLCDDCIIERARAALASPPEEQDG